MRLSYFSSRLLVAVNIVGLLLVLWVVVALYVTHTDLTPEKTERVFKKNISAANKIRGIDNYRQSYHGLLLDLKRERNLHYQDVIGVYWLAGISIVIFLVDILVFISLIRNKSLRIR